MNTKGQLEQLQPDEERLIDEMVEQTTSHMREIDGLVRRGQHAKATGCVAAVFRVVENISENLQHGIFAKPGTTFDALVRFSNSQGTLENDAEGTGRGMAIKLKLRNMIDERAVKGDTDQSQDFLLINHPVFPFPDPQRYLDLVARKNVPFVGRLLALLHLGIAERDELTIVKQIKQKKVFNPLDITYWSGSPYWLGTADGSKGQAVKYSAVPRDPTDQDMPEGEDLPADYLSRALQQRLKSKPVTFDFKVQVQSDPDNMPIEDASRIWDEKLSVPVPAATLTIGVQTVEMLDEVQRECEGLSFNPWHALAAHCPLGGVNRIRRKVYAASFERRSS